MKQVCVLGEGAWGSAIAMLLANNGMRVKLWCHDKSVAEAIIKTRNNERYLKGCILQETIEPVTNFKEALAASELIFEAIPVQFLRSVTQQAKPHCLPQQPWVILSKGIEQHSLHLPTHIIDAVLGYEPKKAVLAGPSFARDLAAQQITAVTLAATDCEFGLSLQALLANDYFRPYVSRDLLGAQIGGAVKNVIALAIGLLDGAGFADNAKSFMLTRGLHEMVLLSQIFGGRTQTLYGLSGVGDLVLTSMGNLSKNRAVGRRLGQGESLETILKETGYIPEGINTVESIHQLMMKKNLDLPICAGVYAIIQGKKTIQEFLKELMARPLEQEC